MATISREIDVLTMFRSICRQSDCEGGISKCRHCRNAYARAYRRIRGPLQGEAKRKDIARSYANVYKRRGHIDIETCALCGEKAQMHHHDYEQPTIVIWLCRKHHLELHRLMASDNNLMR
jgi:hypothetical protein